MKKSRKAVNLTVCKDILRLEPIVRNLQRFVDFERLGTGKDLLIGLCYSRWHVKEWFFEKSMTDILQWNSVLLYAFRLLTADHSNFNTRNECLSWKWTKTRLCKQFQEKQSGVYIWWQKMTMDFNVLQNHPYCPNKIYFRTMQTKYQWNITSG